MPFSALHEAFSRGNNEGEEEAEAAEEEEAAEEKAVEAKAEQLEPRRVCSLPLAVALGKTPMRHLGHIKHICTAHNKGGQYVFWIILIGARRDKKQGKKRGRGPEEEEEAAEYNKKKCATRNIFYGVSFRTLAWTKCRYKHVELIER